MANRFCPICDRPWLNSLDAVPYEDNDRIGTLMFCSEGCKKEYKENE